MVVPLYAPCTLTRRSLLKSLTCTIRTTISRIMSITQHAKYVDRCIKYRDRRIGDPKKELTGEISSGEIPVRMMSPYLATIVHVFHSQAFDSDKRLDLEFLSENESLMAGLKGWNTNIRPWKRSRQIKHRFNR